MCVPRYRDLASGYPEALLRHGIVHDPQVGVERAGSIGESVAIARMCGIGFMRVVVTALVYEYLELLHGISCWGAFHVGQRT